MLFHAIDQRIGNGGGISLGILPFADRDRAQPPPAGGAHPAGCRIKNGMCTAFYAFAIECLYLGTIDGSGGKYARAGCCALNVRNREPFFLGKRMGGIEPIAPAPYAEPLFAAGVAAAGYAVWIG
jgi:hypothetical protein